MALNQKQYMDMDGLKLLLDLISQTYVCDAHVDAKITAKIDEVLEDFKGNNGAIWTGEEEPEGDNYDIWIDLDEVPTDLTGKSAYQIAVENGFDSSETEWLASLHGKPGNAGLSAFEIYKKYHPDYTGTEEEWLASLVGKDYQLTELDKVEIANLAIEVMPKAEEMSI